MIGMTVPQLHLGDYYVIPLRCLSQFKIRSNACLSVTGILLAIRKVCNLFVARIGSGRSRNFQNGFQCYKNICC